MARSLSEVSSGWIPHQVREDGGGGFMFCPNVPHRHAGRAKRLSGIQSKTGERCSQRMPGESVG
ncbi:hypothetical protein [Pseudovibrio ascidiaceicola]|uniref:hypothetical protein n=1 Tax=Pseudovibrio ascidiaceicola TaxID=285279 RepID=UPI0011142204|nr:hypothetical protein [Pseudovibrio ascidiaceicola]